MNPCVNEFAVLAWWACCRITRWLVWAEHLFWATLFPMFRVSFRKARLARSHSVCSGFAWSYGGGNLPESNGIVDIFLNWSIFLASFWPMEETVNQFPRVGGPANYVCFHEKSYDILQRVWKQSVVEHCNHFTIHLSENFLF